MDSSFGGSPVRSMQNKRLLEESEVTFPSSCRYFFGALRDLSGEAYYNLVGDIL